MSHMCALARPPSASSSAFTAASLSALRPTMATVAPSEASSCAVQRPMPLPPPVTMIICPANKSARNTER